MRAFDLTVDELYKERQLGPRWVCSEAVEVGDTIILNGRPVVVMMRAQAKGPSGYPEGPIEVTGKSVAAPNNFAPSYEVTGVLPAGKFAYLIEHPETPTGVWWVSWYSREGTELWTPFKYWCTGSTGHEPSYGTYCAEIHAPTREAAFAQVLEYIPDALHRFCNVRPPSAERSDRFPDFENKRCPRREGGGHQCELRAGHEGDCACPRALARYRARNGLG